MAPHSSTLAWKIPWMEEPGRLQSMGSTERLHFHFSLSCIEKEMTTQSSVLAGRIPGMAEPGGLPYMGSQRVGHDWSDLAAAGVPVTFPLSLSVPIYSWSVCSSEIGGHWVIDIPLGRRPTRHLRTSSIWLQSPFFNIHKRCGKLADHLSLPTSSQTQSLWKQMGFSTAPWDPTLVGGMTSVSFQHQHYLYLQTPRSWVSVLNLANIHLENKLPVFPSRIKPKNSIRMGKGG